MKGHLDVDCSRLFHCLVAYFVGILSPSAADARGVHASDIVNRTPSPSGRLATTSLVVRMTVELTVEAEGKYMLIRNSFGARASKI